MNSIKIPITEFPVLDIIKNRWSARAFAPEIITDTQIDTLLEAASWAASANNEQPWQYIYAHRGSEGFKQIWNCLMPGNQPWAIHAGTFVVSMARTTFHSNQKVNFLAHHDLGMANAHLLLQARSMDIYSHPMAGFDKIKLRETLNIEEILDPVCIIALGYLTNAETLEEPFKTRELTPRTRNAVSQFATKIK